jgi:short-subunit dehydrogenase
MISNKVIVITGASSGIGAELARQLGKLECKLVLAARREPELKRVAEPFGQNAITVVTDVRQRGEVEYLRNRALGEFGQVDVWVNNAGRGIGKKVLELNDEDFDEMIAVNLKSAFYGMQAIVPYFQQRGEGHLINISSFLGRVPLASYRSVYSAAKAALNSLTANLRMDLVADYPNIHISLVMPPTVTSEFAANALGGTPQYAHSQQRGTQTPEEVAAVIVELIRHPLSEVYTNPASAEMVTQYYQDVAAFEARMNQPSR